MFNFIGTDANTEIMIVYSLIALIIVLIVIVILIDRYGKKHERDRLDSKTVLKNLKKIQKQQLDELDDEEYYERLQDTIKIDPNYMNLNQNIYNNLYQEEIKEESKQEEYNNDDLQIQTSLNLDIEEEKEEPLIYQEQLDLDVPSELEKTQAQIEVESITKALEKAIEEEERTDPYAQFEEEQEENAIISYDELEKNYDRLYNENEKMQYINDDKLPINMNELYEKNNEYQTKKVKLDDMNTINTEEEYEYIEKEEEVIPGKFRNSPVISPVYGIQREKVKVRKTENRDIDEELAKTTEFLKTLKDLQKNLDN